MSDVSVEFGAKDTGLENTLKTIQDQLVALDGELKSGTLSFDEINKKMREAAQAEKLHASFGGTKDQIEALGLSFKQTKPEIERFTENQKEAAQETQKASTSFQTMAGEMFELKAALENGNLSADEFDKTLRRLNKLEDIQKKMDAFKQSTTGAGESADQASPEVEELGTDIKKTGKEAQDFGEKSKSGFLKMSGAVAAGQLAAEAAIAGIRAAINLAKGAIDEFGAALDLGGRLSDLAARTGEAEGNLLLLERAFQNSGAGAEQVGPAINKLQRFMEEASNGAAAQVDTMTRLGLSYDELAGKTPTEQLEIFAKRISAIEDPGKRAALAMDVFGRSGGELLPLLTNFSGELGTAQSQLGGMVDIMNKNAATFDAVSDKIAIVRGKFMEFAAGILDRIVPALDAVTEGLSRIDAAAIGQKLADAFLGGTQAMQGFQSAVDAFKVGKISEAFSMLWESVKLQGLQTANEVGRNLVAGFSTAIDFLKEIFNPSGAIVRYMGATFLLIGSKLQAALGNGMLAFIDALPGWFTKINPIIGAVGDAIRGTVTKATEEANLQWGMMYHSTGEVASQIASAASRIKDNMNVNLSETGNLIGGLNERAAALKAKQDEIAAAVTKTNEEKGKGAPIDQQTADAATQQANAAANRIQLQTDLNNAIASGNAAEATRLQKLLDGELAQVRINKLTEDYIKSGLGAPEALQLATNLVNSEIAAANVKKNSEGAKNELGGAANNAKTVKEAIEAVQGTKMDEPAKGLKERTIDARDELKKMQQFIGQDLSGMSLSSIVEKLGLDVPALSSSKDQLGAIEKFIADLGNEDPADVTPEVDVPGSKDNIAQIKQALKETEGTDATPQIDQESVKNQASTARDTIKKDLEQLKAEVTVKPKLDKEALKEEVDMAFASSKGTEHLSSIDKLVGKIEELVSKIEGKLPMQALA